MAEISPITVLAIPGKKKCEICFEEVSSVKILQCGHRFCLPCVLSISAKVGSLCPTCRQPFSESDDRFSRLPTHYFGEIACDICVEFKSIEDFWFCRACFKSFCSRCAMTEHRFHINESIAWDIEQIHTDCLSLLSNLSLCNVDLFEHNKKRIHDFLEPAAEQFAKELQLKADKNIGVAIQFIQNAFGNTSASSSLSEIRQEHVDSTIFKKLAQLTQYELDENLKNVFDLQQVDGTALLPLLNQQDEPLGLVLQKHLKLSQLDVKCLSEYSNTPVSSGKQNGKKKEVVTSPQQSLETRMSHPVASGIQEDRNKCSEDTPENDDTLGESGHKSPLIGFEGNRFRGNKSRRKKKIKTTTTSTSKKLSAEDSPLDAPSSSGSGGVIPPSEVPDEVRKKSIF